MSSLSLNAGVPVEIWAPDYDFIDPGALEQIRRMGSLPGVVKEIKVMPDAHLGKGACVGSVVVSEKALLPAAVGVDIGCGMAALKTDIPEGELDGKLSALRKEIEKRIPVGFGAHQEAVFEKTEAMMAFWSGFNGLTPKVQDLQEKAMTQLGTLGGGNHFIEVCLDEENHVWLMLHSGSRGIGNKVAEAHIHEARGLFREALEEIPGPDLVYLLEGTPEFEAYMNDLHWCQDYAWHNRALMLDLLQQAVEDVLGRPFGTPFAVQCHHNYAARETHGGESVWITRKGAVRVAPGEYGIIPGSMGAKSYIVRGKPGNERSYCSCSHGAGRRFSRGEAKRRFSVADLEAQTAGVECRKDAGVLDEIPGAYKDIDEVMAAQADLVEIVHTLKQVLCVKG